MRVSDILVLLPDAGPIISEYGLHCVGCHYNTLETLEEGCRGHGFQEADIDDLVSDLNDLLASKPARPKTLTLTREAALRLKDILAVEGKVGHGLRVGLDEAGGFCMELAAEPEEGDATFDEAHQEGVRLFASSLTLSRIGGATIDFREERFKLDLPEDTAGCACGGKCACKSGEKDSCACKSETA